MSESYRVPETSDFYPVDLWKYQLGQRVHRWSLNGAPRQDLLVEITVLGFNPEPIAFPPQDLTSLLEGLKIFHKKLGFKERMKTYGKRSTCLPHDHPTLPGLPLGQLLAVQMMIENNSKSLRRRIRSTKLQFFH